MQRETIKDYDPDWVLKSCAVFIGGALLGGALIAGTAAGIRYEIVREFKEMGPIDIDGIAMSSAHNQGPAAEYDEIDISPSHTSFNGISHVVQFL